MVISNWVEKRLEERRIKREQALFEQGRAEGRAEGHTEGRAEGHTEGRAEGHTEGRKEGFEQGRAYERNRIANENGGNSFDERKKTDEE